MIRLKHLARKLTPDAVWSLGRDVRDALVRWRQWPAATFHPWRRSSVCKLSGFHNLHRGQRAFIIGNGPSLKATDLSKLHREITFGMNRIYLLFPEMGYATTYFLSVNDLVIEQCAEDIRNLPVPKFLSWRSRRVIQPTPDIHYLHTTYTGPRFCRDARRRLWEGATVTFVALQLAYFMGFDQVILIGVDHSFTSKGSPNTTIVSDGDDPDHFHPQYFGKGFRWQLPDLDTSERAYQMARETYERAGRRVIDATIGGKLTVFPKVDYDSLF